VFSGKGGNQNRLWGKRNVERELGFLRGRQHGLPIIRVSVDHGTAFGKAGEGRANPESLVDALRIASRFASPGWTASGSAGDFIFMARLDQVYELQDLLEGLPHPFVEDAVSR